MNRTQIINSLCKKINAQSYLEIGTREGRNFDAIQCKKKVGVDPDINAKATFTCTSDEYFAYHRGSNLDKYDIIFIDGMHEHNQAMRDAINSLKVLNENGYIVMHDCNPRSYQSQLVPRQTKQWNGDVWRTVIDLRILRNDLKIFVVDTDEGCGIITRGKSTPLVVDQKITYENFDKNKKEWLNLITVKQFEKWLS